MFLSNEIPALLKVVRDLFPVSSGKPSAWKLIDVMVSSKLDMESALGMLTTLERKPKELGIKVGKIMHVLSKELYSE